MKKQALIAVMAGLAVLGLSLKAASPALVNKVDLTKHEDRLIGEMIESGFYMGGARALTHQGVYRAMSFYHPICKGMLAVVLLDRNGEAANILDGLPGQSGFYYGGTAYDAFPYWPFLWGKLTGGAPVVVGYRESGTCGLRKVFSN
jgi:hypothetical protein